MSVVADAADALLAALRTAAGVRVYDDPGALVDPPAVVLTPPRLTWSGYRSDPTDATFVAVAVVAADERASARLWDLVPLVAAAADELPDAAVKSAQPGTWGSSELPAYLIEIEVAL